MVSSSLHSNIKSRLSPTHFLTDLEYLKHMFSAQVITFAVTFHHTSFPPSNYPLIYRYLLLSVNDKFRAT